MAHALKTVNGYWKQRWEDLRSTAIFRALVASVCLHFTFFTVVEIGFQAGWWKASVWRTVARKTTPIEQRTDLKQTLPTPIPLDEEPTPLIFVEVAPQDAVEPPKDAKYYSTASTIAANPNPPKLEAKQPKIEGTQEKVPKILEVAKLEPKQPEPPPQPKPEVPTPAPPQQVASISQPRMEPDGLKPAKPNPAPLQPQPVTTPPQKSTPPPRARTLAQAKANKGIIEGPPMKQEGGVARASLNTSLDVKGSPFGAYDAAFVAAVQARWFTLLDQRDFARNQSGKVVVDFRLNKDGRITDINIAATEVSETLGWICQRAILDPAPFAPFPSDLKRLLNADSREVRFTFYYN